jgi:nucleotide-binding universal stress UspA family protein
MAEGVLPYAVALARLSAKALILLQVIPSASALPSIGWRASERVEIQREYSEAVAAARASLEQTANQLRADGLVPLDVDAFAEPALEQARHLAAASGATLVLLTAVPDRDDLARATEGMVSFAALRELQAVAEQMTVELAAQTQRLEASGLHVRTILVHGWPAEAILRAVAQEQADLIVMAAHGRGRLQRLRLGSAALQVVRAAAVLVLLVRGSERTQETAIVICLTSAAAVE